MSRSTIAFALSAALLGGCVSLTQDQGFSSVGSTVKERTGKELVRIRSDADADAVRKRVRDRKSVV